MTVTLYSWTPPTTHTSKYLLRPTVLNGPRPDWHDIMITGHHGGAGHRTSDGVQPDTILEDIDDWYSPQIEDDGFLERLDRSAEIVEFP